MIAKNKEKWSKVEGGYRYGDSQYVVYRGERNWHIIGENRDAFVRAWDKLTERRDGDRLTNSFETRKIAGWIIEGLIQNDTSVCKVCGADSSKGVCYGCAVVWNTLNEIASVNPEALDNFIETRKEAKHG